MDIDRLPIGIRSFREIRERGLRYVDKTAHARRLVDYGRHCILSRPRRFGKSLFVDTLEELFKGSEELFRGLDIHPDWDWDDRRPVVRLDFSRGRFIEPGGLERSLDAQLDAMERETGLRSGYQDAGDRLAYLIERLHRREGRRVVLLVDEYDRPITDALGAEEVAKRNQRILFSLYAVTKTHEEDLSLSLFTGVTSFVMADAFSGGANNLIDLSMRPEFSSVSGFTEAELDRAFGRELGGLDREGVREWYNGYSWRGEERLYNPHSTLRLLRGRAFRPWWHRAGVTRLLIDTLARGDVEPAGLGGRVVGQWALPPLYIGRIPVEALMLHHGYLTVTEETRRHGATEYRLDYPNREVRQALGHLGAVRPPAGRNTPA